MDVFKKAALVLHSKINNKNYVTDGEREKALRDLNDWEKNSRMREDEYPEFLKRFYKHHTGKDLNLENPQSFNEKVQWAKLYDRDPLRTKLSDKHAVREWVEERIGAEYLIPLLGVWESADDIDFDELPNRFVLKCTHGSSMNIIVEDKTQLDTKETCRKLNEWQRTNFGYKDLELNYVDIPPRIIAEEYMEDTECGDLADYKFYCFSGEPYCCQAHIERYVNHREDTYDLDWNMAPFQVSEGHPNSEQGIPKPINLDNMLELSRRLAAGMPFVRVDLYSVSGKIYFGEMTFTPSSGAEIFTPPEYDEMLGKLYKLPRKT